MTRSKMQKSSIVMMAVAAAAFLVAMQPDMAFAGADTTFDDVWVTMRDWTQGSLGKVIAGSFVLIGLVSGAARQSVSGFAVAAGSGIGMYAAPDVIEEMVSATLPAAQATVDPSLLEILASAVPPELASALAQFGL